MKVVIDTASLLSLVRYYLRFDGQSVLFNFLKSKIERGEILVIDKVFEQCSYIAGGIVLKKLPYLTDSSFRKEAKLPVKTDSIIAPSPSKFLRQVDNQFVNPVQRKRLNDAEYEVAKSQFLEDADARMVILCLNLKKDHPNEEVILVTEESGSNNDNKAFKKIPAICKELNIACITLPDLLEKYAEINVGFSGGTEKATFKNISSDDNSDSSLLFN